MSLNLQQISAVECDDPVILIVAGAGTGKTTTIVEKICRAIEVRGVLPYEIIATTFTNKAATELKERLIHRIGPSATSINIGTFHRLSVDIIREHGTKIGIPANFITLPAEDQLLTIKNSINKYKFKDFHPSRLLDKIHKYKEGDVSSLNSCEMQVFETYQAHLKYSNMLDFTDLMLGAVKIWSEHPDVLAEYHDRIRLICIDEFQDINNLQYKWMKLINGTKSQLCCVGDSDQAIYGFRNANAGYILDFDAYFTNPTIIKLEQNYRSKAQILKSANSLICHNKRRIEKELKPNNSDNSVSVEISFAASCGAEAANIAKAISKIEDSSIAVLVRNRSIMQAIEEALLRNGLQYKIIGSINFINRAEIKDMLAYLKFLENPKDQISFKRLIMSPKRGIGETTIDKIIHHAEENQCDLMRSAVEICSKMSQSYQTKISELAGIFREAKTLQDPFATANHFFNKSQYAASISEDRVNNINQWILSLSEFKSVSEYLEKIVWQYDESSNENNLVQVMTIHASKGLEFDHVFLPGWEEGILPNAIDINELEEERRLAYVALTRARTKATISYVGMRYVNGMPRECRPSRFIRELGVTRLQSTAPGPKLSIGLRVLHHSFGVGYIVESGISSSRVKFFNAIRVVDTASLKELR